MTIATTDVQTLNENHDISEVFLTKKFNRPSKTDAQITYEITDDPALLHQYYLLRNKMFIDTWGLQNFSGMKDEFDDNSHVVIAHIDRLCIGGCRLTYKRPYSNDILPMEKNGFLLVDTVPDIPIDDALCAEWSRMSILPEYQNSVVIVEITRKLIEHSIKTKANFTFWLSPMTLARNYRKVIGLFGLNMEIRRDVVIPDCESFEGVKMFLSLVDWSLVRNVNSKTTEAKEDLLPA
jgi:hypothetical protein